MNDGLSPARQLRRGIARRGKPQLYVRRRTSRKGGDRILVSLTAPYRYAICVWGSYRAAAQRASFAQELHSMIAEAMRLRLGDNWEVILQEEYEKYSAKCDEAGEVNIFEAVVAR